MTDIQKRFLLFLLGCIPVRLGFVVWSLFMSPAVFKLFAVFAGAIGVGLWVIFLTGVRKVGLETIGAPIWWNLLRPFHGALWLLVAFFSWKAEREMVWRILLTDVCIGLVAFLAHHGLSGNGGIES